MDKQMIRAKPKAYGQLCEVEAARLLPAIKLHTSATTNRNMKTAVGGCVSDDHVLVFERSIIWLRAGSSSIPLFGCPELSAVETTASFHISSCTSIASASFPFAASRSGSEA